MDFFLLFFVILYASCFTCYGKAPAKITDVSPKSFLLQRVAGGKWFTCSASGQPTPVIRWYKGNNLVQGWKESIKSTGGVFQQRYPPHRLALAYAREADAGNYTCRATNEIVVGSKTVKYTDEKSVILRDLIYPLQVGNCSYHVNHYESLNAQNAATRCKDEETSLAILASEVARIEMISEIEKYYGENPINFWIGATKDDADWWWDDNSNISSDTLDQTAPGNCLTLKYSDSNTRLVPAQCASNEGFICEKQTDGGKPCETQSCNNRGTCVNVGCHYKCTCQAGYDGKDCERDPCTPNPCSNGGICSWIATAPYYECACREVYGGQNCTRRKYPLKVGNCRYHLNHYESRNAQSAKTRCQNDNTVLAIVKSDTTNNAVISDIERIYGKDQINFWIGAENDNGSWRWNDKTLILPKAVDTTGTGTCLALKYVQSATSLLTAECASSDGFICEKPVANPCKSQFCSGYGTCKAVGCHYICTCSNGYLGNDCERDAMVLKTQSTQLSVLHEEKLNITIEIETEDFPVQITLCDGLSYETKINGIQTKAFTGLIGPFLQPNPGINCRVTVVSVNGGYSRNLSFEIIVFAPAKITDVSPKSFELKHVTKPVAGGVYFTCSASGQPTPVIKWYKDSKLVQGWSQSISSTGGVFQQPLPPHRLVLGHAREADVGNYTCRATNEIVVGSNTVQYTDGKSVLLRVALKRISKTIQPEKDYVEETEISCSYKSYPRPTISWKYIKDSKTYDIYQETGSIFTISSMTNDSQVITYVDSKLQIRLADCLGAVTVECLADDTYDNRTSRFQLNQRMKPLGEKRYIFSGTTINGYEYAQNYCEYFGATLATIRDQKTQEFLTQHDEHFHRDYSTFVGGMAYDEEGSRLWKWTDGSVFYNETKHGSWNSDVGTIVDGVYVAWNQGKPAAISGKNCAHLMRVGNRTWANAKCTAKLASVCERTAESTPVNQSVRAEDCAASITVSWKPAQIAVGIKHRVEVKPENDLSAIKPTPINIVAEDKLYQNVFHNLSFATEYSIMIYVCPDQCLSECRTVQLVTTGAGIPSKVRHVNVSKSDISSVCTISWTAPISVFGIFSYEIAAEFQFVHFFGDDIRNKIFNERINHTTLEQLQLNYSTSPNRNYTFSVQAMTCSGLGRQVVAEGRCTTKRAAPSYVPNPQPGLILDDGTLSINLTAIDESNGPASCVIVVIITNPDSHSNNSKYGQEELQRASSFGAKNINPEYITLALSRTALSGRVNGDGKIALKIGDNSTTTCDASQYSTTGRRRRATSETTFQGRNIPLNKNHKIGVIIVVATPVDGEEILYKSSEMAEYGTNITPIPPPSNVWIAGVVIGVIVIIAALVIAIFMIKRRKEGTKTEVLDDRTIVPMTALPNSVEPLYANLTNESTDLRSKTDIPLERLENVYNSMKANKNSGFVAEYEALKKEAKALGFSKDVASEPSLKKKNRYKNILPFDKTRVKLSGDGDESYINASYIEGFNQPNKFIATQGPLPSTVDDFWRMVVEQQCRIIVMLTKCFEKGKKKCEHYWPDLQHTKHYGKVTVSNQDEATFGSFVKATLKINTESGEEITVYHFQLLEWPDHGVPVTTSNFFRVQSAVAECQRDVGGNMPIVVHCSAGAGRSGAFIAYDCLSEESTDLKRVDIYNCILNMRKQRVDMVQTCDQYIFVHKLLLEDFIFGTTQITGSEASAILRKPNAEARISEEFSKLDVLKPIHAELHGAHHDTMNRNKNIVPYERTKVIVTRIGHETVTPYINASFMETYNDSYTLIAAQGPVEASVENFWRSAFDNDVTIIIALTKCIEGNKEQCVQYWPNEVGDSLQLKHISVEMKMQYIEGQIVVREMHVKKEEKLKKIVQYHYKDWPVSSCPSDPTGILTLVNKMKRELHPRGKPAVLVHCSDGAGRTGAFCAIVNLMDRLNNENVVDVFREVKDLRDCRPGMVQTPGQYHFCYQVIEAYIAASSVYSNFDVSNEEKVYENL